MKKAMIDYQKKPKFDDLYTPEYAITPLLEYIPQNTIIWECTDFDEESSNITKVLRKNGHKVISTGKEENFFTYKPEEPFDMIITNPPYSLKDEFLEKCYEWNKPFCLLLPITALEGLTRGKLFQKYGIEVMVLDKRIEFMKDSKNNNWFNTSWFCWKVLPEKLIFKTIQK